MIYNEVSLEGGPTVNVTLGHDDVDEMIFVTTLLLSLGSLSEKLCILWNTLLFSLHP